MARNIEDLSLDEITEDFLLEQCIEMGEALGVDTRQGSIYRDASDGHIIRTAKFFDDLRKVRNIISITTCTGDILDEKMKENGMERNPPAATPAIYYVEFTGSVPEIGDVVSCEGHMFTVDILEGRYVIVSEEVGAEMNNLVKGSFVVPEIDVDGLISATLQDLAVPAVDEEEDDLARERFLNKVSGPDENGNASQVRTWCESVKGVGRARVIPVWNGPNTVKGIIISRDGRAPTQAVVDAVQEYVDPGAAGMGEGKATIGQRFTAESVQEVSINVNATIIKSAESTYSEIYDSLRSILSEYFKTIALEVYSADIMIRYNRVSAIITDIGSIIDHENLLLNGGTDNISFTRYQIPVLGEVVINGYIQ